MQRQRILLVQLYSAFQPPNAEPFAVEVLASFIENNFENIVVDIYVLNPEIDDRAVDGFLQHISKNDYSLIGLSVPQGTYHLAKEVLMSISETGTDPLMVLGHAIPTYAPEQFLDEFPNVVVVHGWGEDALLQLVRYVSGDISSLESINNISFFDRQLLKIVSTPIKYLAVPTQAKRIDPQRYFARVETSRDCHYGVCTFCTRPPGLLRDWHRLPVSDILDSVSELKDNGVTYFTFTDEDFVGNDLDGALRIAEGIKAIGNMTFSISLRADNILNPKLSADSSENQLRDHVIGQLKQAGLSFMFIGLESLSDTQLKRYGKGISTKNSVEAINVVKKHGIPLEVGYILFDPFVTLAELQEITETLRTTGIWNNVGRLFSEMRIQRATAYEQWLRQKGLLGEFDPNFLSYEWSFQHSEVAKVAMSCRSWVSPFSGCRNSLLNLVRTDIENEIAKYFATLFRKLDLLVLESIVSMRLENKGQSEVQDVMMEFEIQRYTLAGTLSRKVSKSAEIMRAEIQNLLTDLALYKSTIENRIGDFVPKTETEALGFIESN